MHVNVHDDSLINTTSRTNTIDIQPKVSWFNHQLLIKNMEDHHPDKHVLFVTTLSKRVQLCVSTMIITNYLHFII